MSSEHTLKPSCAMRFICFKNVLEGAFSVIKCPYACKLSMSWKIRKIPSLVYFHSLYQLLHSQVLDRNDLKL